MLGGRTTPSALAEARHDFLFFLVAGPVALPQPNVSSPLASGRHREAAQHVIARRTTITGSFSRMSVSARSPCSKPEPETDDLTPRSAEGSPTFARRGVAANAIQRVIACRRSPYVAHRVAVCARAPQDTTPEQRTDGPTGLCRPQRFVDHAFRPTRRARARRRRQTLADHFIVSTISHHFFFVSTTSHHHITSCEPIATHHLAGRALPCNHARSPREGRARPHSQFRIVTQSCHSTF